MFTFFRTVLEYEKSPLLLPYMSEILLKNLKTKVKYLATKHLEKKKICLFKQNIYQKCTKMTPKYLYEKCDIREYDN